jgi:hypothetical protein
MQRADIERIFEAYFEKYKKTEGDRSSWSAFWTDMTPAGVLEINLTKCPKGTTFKVFVDKRKVAEVTGWDAYFEAMDQLAGQHPGLYDPDRLFSEMELML